MKKLTIEKMNNKEKKKAFIINTHYPFALLLFGGLLHLVSCYQSKFLFILFLVLACLSFAYFVFTIIRFNKYNQLYNVYGDQDYMPLVMHWVTFTLVILYIADFYLHKKSTSWTLGAYGYSYDFLPYLFVSLPLTLTYIIVYIVRSKIYLYLKKDKTEDNK